MRRIILAVAVLALMAGCSAIKGERFWWNDQQQTKLDNNYELPEWPAETPVPQGERLYVDKKFKPNEVERARAQEKKQIAAGIPRCGVPDPNLNPVPVKVAKWGDTDGDAKPSAEAKKSPAKTSPEAPAAPAKASGKQAPASKPADNLPMPDNLKK